MKTIEKRWILIDFIKDYLGMEKAGYLRGLSHRELTNLAVKAIMDKGLKFTTEGE